MIFKKYIPKIQIYRPSSDETVKQVADKFNTSLEHVKCLSVAEHYEGEFLEIAECSAITHIVRPLETIEKVAKEYNVSVEYIMQNNHLNSKNLFIGQRIYL